MISPIFPIHFKGLSIRMKEPELRKTPRPHYVYVIEVIVDKGQKQGAATYFNPGLGTAAASLELLALIGVFPA